MKIASRTQGYRISIRSMGINALNALLPPEKLSRLSKARVADVGDGYICANAKMEPVFTIPQGQDAAVQFLRSELRGLLMEGVDIEWGKRLTANEKIIMNASGRTVFYQYPLSCSFYHVFSITRGANTPSLAGKPN